MARQPSKIMSASEKKAAKQAASAALKDAKSFLKDLASKAKAAEKAHAAVMKDLDKQQKAAAKAVADAEKKLAVFAPAATA